MTRISGEVPIDRCENCYFARGALGSFDGVCHKRAPEQTEGKTVWPRVMANDFCGDFENKNTPEAYSK